MYLYSNKRDYFRINTMFSIIIIGVLAGFLVLFLNYCMGKPGSEKFSPYEIFSSYTVWLSKRRLKQVGLFKQYFEQYLENLLREDSTHREITLKNDYKKIYYEAAEPFFTWERAVGMCPVCFGFWVAFITSAVFCEDPLGFIVVIITSHITIRLLTKII